MVKRIQNLIFSSFIVLLFHTNFYSQCAGNDESLTICNKETYNQGIGNPNGIVNLFSILTGESPGGTWVDLNSSGGLNTTTGILNTYLINRGGVFNYRYTVNGIPGCTDNISIVTITLGGYPGVDNFNATACNNNTMVPLFSFLGSNPNPHFNGTWTGGPMGAITGNFFNAQQAGVGTYNLTYTVAAVGTCPARSASLSLTVHELPISGTPMPLVFCETDNFSSFTNFNLLDQLTGEDSGGFWTDNNGTGEISDASDSFINIQNIALNFGPGTYTFTYNVNPSHPICPPASSNVAITIRPIANLTGATLNVAPNICFNQIGITNIVATITQGPTPIPNGTYNISYTLSGANTGNVTIPVIFNMGSGTFIVDSMLLTNTGSTNVNITSIEDTINTPPCTRTVANLNDSFIINPNPDLSDSLLNINDICIGQTAIAELNDNTAPTIQLLNGTYTITYNLIGPGLNSLGNTASITVNNGLVAFNLNTSTLPEGNYTVTITNIVNPLTNCASTVNLSNNFDINPIPDPTNIIITIDNICDGGNVIVNLSGANNLTDGNYNINYSISGAITVSNQTINNIAFTSGNASFTLPNGILNIGTSILTINNLQNLNTSCTGVTTTNPQDTFEIFALPNSGDIVANSTNICLGSPAIINFLDNNIGVNPELTNGNYSITYQLSGANNSGLLNAIVSITNGAGTLTIPSGLLTNFGSTTVTVNFITNTTSGCNVTGGNITTTFTILPIPDLSNATLTVNQPICIGQGTAVSIQNATIANGNYTLTYNITGTINNNNLINAVVFNNGNTNFNLPNTLINAVGNYTITITNIADNNSVLNCSNAVTNLTGNFVVNPNPDVINTTIITQSPVCIGDNVVVTMNNLVNGLSNGTYDIIYNLSGANTANNQSATININNGSGTFTINNTLINASGNYTITITSITNNATGCNSAANLITNFVIVPLPDLTNASVLVAEPICLGTAANVSITAPTILNGNYNLIYNLSNSNVSNNNTVSVTFNAGNGTFTIPSTLLTNSGNTSITIVSASSANNCTINGLNITDSFIVSPIPTLLASQLSANDICIGTDGTVSINGSNLIDGNYSITYSLSGANIATNQSASFTITANNGQFIIPNALLINIGNSLIEINTITNLITTCSNNLTGVNTSFVVNPIPNLIPSNIVVNDICFGINNTAQISGATNLLNGNYTITYNLTGANNSSNNSATGVMINNGTGSFSIPSSLLANLGNTTINIVAISNITNNCTNNSLAITDTFEVLPLPVVTGINFSSPNICQGSDATLSFVGANGLTNGNYNLTYNISGSNTSSNNAVMILVNNGSGSFIIPSSLLTNTGNVTVSFLNIVSGTTSCGNNMINISPVNFVVNSTATPVLITDGNKFCAQKNPRISDLSLNATGSGTLTWYNTPTNGNAYQATDLLVNGTTYYASLTSSTGCSSLVRLEVTVDLTACNDLFIPDGFSPNNDGLNDQFYVKNLEDIYPSFDLEIYNRYGSLVYKGNRNTPRFDGKANQTLSVGSDILPTGVYFYVITPNDSKNSGQIQGRLYLSR